MAVRLAHPDMRAAVISDIHSNLPALTAVLADIDRLDPAPSALWCLGDVVGYGGSPNECLNLIRKRCQRSSKWLWTSSRHPRNPMRWS